MKMDLLTNATIVDDAIRFVSDKSKDRLKASSFSNSDEHQKEESKEPDKYAGHFIFDEVGQQV
jgi:hypothetical protein